MTETTKTIFKKYEIRKTKAQKSVFIAYIESLAQTYGYTYRIEKGWLGARNIIVGDPELAKVVCTAHYDTCPRLPFPNFITPRHIWIYLLYQVIVVLGIMVLPMFLAAGGMFFLGDTLGWDEDITFLAAYLVGYGIMLACALLILAGPANKHTANDNTSGVTVLTDLMAAMPEEYRTDAAFVFFDLEEAGLFGSGGYAAKHKKEMAGKPLLNFDCVSDGDTILVAVQKGAGKYISDLQAAFTDTDSIRTDIACKGVFYPSDQMNFPCGIGVAALKRTKRGNILYMDRIHTKRDTVYMEENIAYLVNASVELTKRLSAK